MSCFLQPHRQVGLWGGGSENPMPPTLTPARTHLSTSERGLELSGDSRAGTDAAGP